MAGAVPIFSERSAYVSSLRHATPTPELLKDMSDSWPTSFAISARAGSTNACPRPIRLLRRQGRDLRTSQTMLPTRRSILQGWLAATAVGVTMFAATPEDDNAHAQSLSPTVDRRNFPPLCLPNLRADFRTGPAMSRWSGKRVFPQALRHKFAPSLPVRRN